VTIDMLPNEILLEIFIATRIKLAVDFMSQSRGICWYTCVKDGENLYLDHRKP
jgi:hypothetical protein